MPLLVLVLVAAASAVELEKIPIAIDGPAKPYRLAPWSIANEWRSGGTDVQGKCLWLNTDWKARPWAGIAFRTAPENSFTLTEEWLTKGFIRFAVNVGRDRYGNPGGGVRLQLRPEAEGLRYQALRSAFVDRGRGMDEDPGTWQDVLVPLSYWTNLKPGLGVTGLSIQCYLKPDKTFAYDAVEYVRFDAVPDWVRERENAEVCQPHVEWPEFGSLPESLRADRNGLKVVDKAFVDSAGKRTFVINPYCREDARLDVWGGTAEDRRDTLPDYGLFSTATHGWLYRNLLTTESLCRLGFNSYSATMPGAPWFKAAGHTPKRPPIMPPPLAETAARIGLPFFVDTVAWPWTVGAPGVRRELTTGLPADAFTVGRAHWTPYRIIGAGRDAWLKMWRVYAQRYRNANVPVFGYELMNEPAYLGLTDDHRTEFITWLRTRYGTLEQLNRTWQSSFDSWEDASDFTDDDRVRKNMGRCFDYDEYLSERFTELIRDGVAAVTEILPNTLTGVQTMGGYALSPREAIWKHRFIEHETLVLTPTGGGRWTVGHGARKPPARAVDSPMAGAPLEPELLRSLADRKMIFDNETYLRGHEAIDVRNRLWEHVMAGLDGLTVFSWSKRGWAWWKDRKAVQIEADKFPYTALNPVARRTASLRGIHDFSAEVQPIASLILPKPWGPVPKIGILYSWAQARRKTYDSNLRDKTAHYYAALKYGHWNIVVVPSNRLHDMISENELDVIVAGGVAVADESTVRELETFVAEGGVLLVGEEALAEDLYGHTRKTSHLLGVAVEAQDDQTRERDPATLLGDISLQAGVEVVRPNERTRIVLRDSGRRPILTRHPLGKGLVYYQAADLIGYSLAKICDAALNDAAREHGKNAVPVSWRLAEITSATSDQMATNVLLSRRSYNTHHAFLLMNRDEYARSVRLRIPGLVGNWSISQPLAETAPAPSSATAIAEEGVYVDMAPGSPAVVLLQRP